MEGKTTMFSKEFNVSGIGKCELQVIEESDKEWIDHPTAYIVKDNKEIICSLDLFAPKYESSYNLTESQKLDIANGLETPVMARSVNKLLDPWKFICIYWTDLNGGYDELIFPEVPPDYFSFRSNINPK